MKAIGPVRGTIGPLFMNFLRASGPGSFSFLSQTSGSIFSPFHGPLSLEPLARRHVLFHFARGPFIPSLGPLRCWSLQRNIAYNYGILFSQCKRLQHMWQAAAPGGSTRQAASKQARVTDGPRAAGPCPRNRSHPKGVTLWVAAEREGVAASHFGLPTLPAGF